MDGQGSAPREATIKAMDEITGPVIAITLVLSSVFIPTAFLAGITGQFYRQFALTIAASTIISAINAMTMAPARAVTLIKPHVHGQESHREALPRWGLAALIGFIAYALLASRVLAMLGVAAGGHGHESEAAGESAHSLALVWGVRLGIFALGTVLGWFVAPPVNAVLNRFLAGFNWVFDRLSGGYGFLVRGLLRVSFILLVVYGGLLAMTGLGFKVVPKGFIPDQDKGYLVVNVQLPDGASLERTDRLVTQLSKIALETEGVAHVIAVPGYSTLLSTNISNVGGMFVILGPFEERKEHPELHGRRIAAELRRKFDAFQEATIGVFGAPPVEGLGSTGGIKLQIQDKRDAGLRACKGPFRPRPTKASASRASPRSSPPSA